MESSTTAPICAQGQHIASGNRCGHNPSSPAWDKVTNPERNGNLPPLMVKCIDRLRGYYAKPETLPTLARLNGKTNRDGSPRAPRSEGREADILVASAILHCTDLVSLQVGTPVNSRKFIPRSCQQLAEFAGLLDPVTGAPSKRFWRSFQRLQRAGLLDVHKVVQQNADGGHSSGFAVKQVAEEFLHLLLGGTDAALNQIKAARHSAYQATKARRCTGPRRDPREVVANRISARMASKATAKAQRASNRSIGDYQRAKTQAQLAALEANPSWGPAQLSRHMATFPTAEQWFGLP